MPIGPAVALAASAAAFAFARATVVTSVSVATQYVVSLQVPSRMAPAGAYVTSRGPEAGQVARTSV